MNRESSSNIIAKSTSSTPRNKRNNDATPTLSEGSDSWMRIYLRLMRKFEVS